MNTQIQTLMKLFAGKEIIFVVVNEAYTPGDIFQNKIGDEYVEIAFQTARATNPSAILIYNDYFNHTSSGKWSGERTKITKDIVEKLKSQNLIDGVGVQMPIVDANTPPAKDDVIETMRNYGLPVYVSEFGVTLQNVGGTNAERFAKQAQIYKDMLEATIESNVGKAFIPFQLGDKFHVWENLTQNPFYSKKADPTPFDDNLQPKPAYFAMQEVLQKYAQGG